MCDGVSLLLIAQRGNTVISLELPPLVPSPVPPVRGAKKGGVHKVAKKIGRRAPSVFNPLLSEGGTT
jgi:hypothetical protein